MMANLGVFSLGMVVALGAAVGAMAGQQHTGTHETTLTAPESIRVEHEELHSELAAATKLSGRTGAAARQVAERLHPHFVSEEEFALPPLALLQPLAAGAPTPAAHQVVAMTDRLKAEMPRMLDEHKAIVAALNELKRAAKDERHPEVEAFAVKLVLHAQHEEQVLYPAAILVGEYLKAEPGR